MVTDLLFPHRLVSVLIGIWLGYIVDPVKRTKVSCTWTSWCNWSWCKGLFPAQRNDLYISPMTVFVNYFKGYSRQNCSFLGSNWDLFSKLYLFQGVPHLTIGMKMFYCQVCTSLFIVDLMMIPSKGGFERKNIFLEPKLLRLLFCG